MRKSVDPRMAIAILVIVVLVVGYLFVRKAKGPGKRMMTPAGLVDVKTGQLVEGQEGRRRTERSGTSQEPTGGRTARR